MECDRKLEIDISLFVLNRGSSNKNCKIQPVLVWWNKTFLLSNYKNLENDVKSNLP